MKLEFLIALLFILVWLGYFLRRRISEETNLIRQTEAAILIDEIIETHFEPLTKKERIDVLEKHIDQMKAIQDRVSKSLIAKRFVDYRESIAFKEKHLNEIKQGQDQYHFTTSNLHTLIADKEFKKEQLVKLADILDDAFIWDDASAMFTLHSTNQRLSINMSLFENVELNREECQEFINQVSTEVFQGRPISLQISHSEPEREEFYESIIR